MTFSSSSWKKVAKSHLFCFALNKTFFAQILPAAGFLLIALNKDNTVMLLFTVSLSSDGRRVGEWCGRSDRLKQRDRRRGGGVEEGGGGRKEGGGLEGG